jgi:hypothetical protein
MHTEASVVSGLDRALADRVVAQMATVSEAQLEAAASIVSSGNLKDLVETRRAIDQIRAPQQTRI